MNKKNIIIITIIILIIMTVLIIINPFNKKNNENTNGNSNNEQIINPTPIEKEKDVEFKVVDFTESPSGARFALKNNSDKEYWYGPSYTIERKENGQWVKVNTLSGEPLMWITVVYELEAKQSEQLTLEWASNYGELKSGEYRICKTVFTQDENADNESIELYAEFSI